MNIDQLWIQLFILCLLLFINRPIKHLPRKRAKATNWFLPLNFKMFTKIFFRIVGTVRFYKKNMLFLIHQCFPNLAQHFLFLVIFATVFPYVIFLLSVHSFGRPYVSLLVRLSIYVCAPVHQSSIFNENHDLPIKLCNALFTFWHLKTKLLLQK